MLNPLEKPCFLYVYILSHVVFFNYETVTKNQEYRAKSEVFPIRISSVNVTKSSVSCGFGTEEILNGKFHFSCNGNTDFVQNISQKTNGKTPLEPQQSR